MIEKALKYIVGLKNPEILEIGAETYSDKPLHRVAYKPLAEAVEMNTLSSLIDYIHSGVDHFGKKIIIHVKSPTCVEMYSALDDDREREYFVRVNAKIPEFQFDRFIDHEAFCINVQSKFVFDPDTDQALILKFAGTVEAGTVAEYGDDGITQKATVKTGIASKNEAIVPNPVVLKAYRTFPEVEQPVQQFIFRMKQDKYDGIQCALFEADGGAWKINAVKTIKKYLEANIADPNFIVIS